MKDHIYLAIFGAIALLCFIGMLAMTIIWMHVPTMIIYQKSSRHWTAEYPIEVKEHGHSYFLTHGQKQVIDLIRFYTPIIWFSCFGYLFLFTAFGGFERLRLLRRQRSRTGFS